MESEYLSEHVPELNVQDPEELNSPVVLLLDQVTDPVGELPSTVTVQVVEEFAVTVEGLQLTKTPVVTVIVIVPELPRLCESPA